MGPIATGILAADHGLVRDYIADARHRSVREIARKYGYTREYVTRLCREGKVRGHQGGTDWYIDEDSFKNYFVLREHERTARRRKLAAERQRQYRDAQTAASLGQNSVTPLATVAPNTGARAMDDNGVCFRLFRLRIQIRLDRSEPSN